jgi:hypothetical protein
MLFVVHLILGYHPIMFTDLHPMPSFRIIGAIPPLLLYVFMARTDKTLHYILYVTCEILPARTSTCSLLRQGERRVANCILLAHGEMESDVKW